jgi:hypothetical protein
MKTMQRARSIEVYSDNQFTIDERADGTHICGLLAYPGISKNLKLYSIGELMKGDNLILPVWLNHAGLVGTDDIGPDILPESYRLRLAMGEEIIIGETHTIFDPQTLQLKHETIITDSFYQRPEILRRMSVSQGVLHDRDLKTDCDDVVCWKKITGSIYQEMSLVFHPGFSIATIELPVSQETIENNNAYNLSNLLIKHMSDDNTKSKENEKPCGCDKSKEASGQASGVMSEAGNCPEGSIFVREGDTGRCVPINEAGNGITNAGSKGVASVPGAEAVAKAENDVKIAQEALKTITENLTKVNEADDEDKKKEEMKKKEDDKDKSKENKKWEVPEGTGPNADTGSRYKDQKKYNDDLKAHYKATEALQTANTAYVKAVMLQAKENARPQVPTQTNTVAANKKKSIEAASLSVKQWMDAGIRGDDNISNNKKWVLNDDVTNTFTTKKFKSTEGVLYSDKFTNYNEHMKSIEADDVAMAGGTDPNNFQRTMSELVLIYPDGDIITPIQQFCETAILPPGKKQHLFYDTKKATFKPTDETNMDAQGSGYALAPSELIINASGGNLSPVGALTRIGFTKLEEIPIDLVQKVNIGFAMEAENQKNLEVLTTCYDDDTAYDPTTDAIKPKGGGDKGAADSKGNTHWVNGNTGVQLTSTDSGATSYATFTGLMSAKKILWQTGLNISNAVAYLDPAGIIQMTDPSKNSGISTYLQRSVPEVITEGFIEKLAGVQLVASSQTAVGDVADIRRGVIFLPIVSFGAVTGRETQIDAERVARQQSFFLSASLKFGAFCKKVESTVRFSFDITE